MLNQLDRLIDTLPQEEQVFLITKKLTEMPWEVKYQILLEQLEISRPRVFPTTSNYLDDIALQIQTAQNFDIPSILELLIAHHRRKKNQGN
ncbi:hypothetical protein H6G64_30100 [Calothrix sp. FACHB-156]|nr:hypothetical protein [Calothrix sp. FACHB-156]